MSLVIDSIGPSDSQNPQDHKPVPVHLESKLEQMLQKQLSIFKLLDDFQQQYQDQLQKENNLSETIAKQEDKLKALFAQARTLDSQDCEYGDQTSKFRDYTHASIYTQLQARDQNKQILEKYRRHLQKHEHSIDFIHDTLAKGLSKFKSKSCELSYLDPEKAESVKQVSKLQSVQCIFEFLPLNKSVQLQKVNKRFYDTILPNYQKRVPLGKEETRFIGPGLYGDFDEKQVVQWPEKSLFDYESANLCQIQEIQYARDPKTGFFSHLAFKNFNGETSPGYDIKKGSRNAKGELFQFTKEDWTKIKIIDFDCEFLPDSEQQQGFGLMKIAFYDERYNLIRSTGEPIKEVESDPHLLDESEFLVGLQFSKSKSSGLIHGASLIICKHEQVNLSQLQQY